MKRNIKTHSQGDDGNDDDGDDGNIHLKVEIKGYEVVPFPKEEECSEFMGDETCFDNCTDEASTKAAEGQSCVSYEVLVLTPSNS